MAGLDPSLARWGNAADARSSSSLVSFKGVHLLNMFYSPLLVLKGFKGNLSLLEICFSPPDRKGLLDFMLESTFAMLLHHAPTQYPARAALQWIPPSIPPEQLVSGSRRVSRQSCLPVDPAQYPARAARQRIPPSIPPERLASGSRRVSRRAACQWIPPSILPERLASGSRRVFCQRGSPVDPAEYPARVARQWIPRSSSPVDPAEYPAEYPTQ